MSQPSSNEQTQTRVLVVAAHPDDEVLGCGGTILKHLERDDTVDILILGEGSNRLKPGLCQSIWEPYDVNVRQFFLPDNKLDTVPVLQLAQEVEAVYDVVHPSVVYTHFIGDLNVDHRRVSEAVRVALRAFRRPVKAIYQFDVPSSTEYGLGPFKPSVFVDIAGLHNEKLNLLGKYGPEVEGDGNPRTLEAVVMQDRVRGLECGLMVAEGFVPIRVIQ